MIIRLNIPVQQTPVNVIKTMQAKYERGMYLLDKGNLIEGMTLYDARWYHPDMAALKQKLVQYAPYVNTWDEIKGKSIIVTGEQGFGDELMFSRAFASLQEVCPKILAIASHEVKPFLQFNYPKIDFIGMGDPLQHRMHEFQGITTIANMFRAYLLHHKDLPPIPAYTGQFPMVMEQGKPKIGLVYKAGKTGTKSAQRSIPVKVFESLATDYDLYSFQVPSENVSFVKENLGNRFNSFLDTANYLSAMDIAISCDTSFVHLALNMRKPTIMVYDHYLDWRWKNNIYPDVKIVNHRNLKQAVLSP